MKNLAEENYYNSTSLTNKYCTCNNGQICSYDLIESGSSAIETKSLIISKAELLVASDSGIDTIQNFNLTELIPTPVIMIC